MDFKPETDLTNVQIGKKDSSIFDAISQALKDKPKIVPQTTLDGHDE